jgi:hypothetical protein
VVRKMIAEKPAMPEQADESYHIVSMDWWEHWKNYTSYDKTKDDITTISTIIEEDNGETLAEDLDNL